MLAGGERDVACGKLLRRGVHDGGFLLVLQSGHVRAADHLRASARRGIEQRLVEQKARKAGAAKRQLQPFVPPAEFKAELTGRPRAELPYIEPEPRQQRLRFSA